MQTKGKVIAFAGAIGSGKSTVSKMVSEMTGIPRVSFGDYVRSYAARNGMGDDRLVLQRLGQALILRDVEDFVRQVLAQAPNWKDQGNLIVDGLRHVEVRQALLQEVRAIADLKLVVVRVDEDTRQQRASSIKEIEPRLLSRYDQDITEAQITRILPGYKDIDVDGSLPVELAASDVIRKLNLPTSALEAAE